MPTLGSVSASLKRPLCFSADKYGDDHEYCKQFNPKVSNELPGRCLMTGAPTTPVRSVDLYCEMGVSIHY